MATPRRRPRRRFNPGFILVVFLAALLVVLCIIAISISPQSQPTVPTEPSGSTGAPSDPTESQAPTGSTQPPATSEPTQPSTGATEPPTEPPTQPTTEPTTQPTQPNMPTEPNPSGSAVLAPPVVSDRDKNDPSFFDDAAFLGDSVTLMLRNYNTSTKALGKANILCAGSYAVRHAIDKVGGKDVISISYQGQKMRPEDALAASGAKKVFIMLGMNDIGLLGVDKTIENWGILLANIRSKCPDIAIYIQSATPIQTGGEKGKLNNKNMDEYNRKLQQFAQDNGCYFVDVAVYMKDSTGGLAQEYCSDDFVHLTNAGAECWTKVLRAFVGD